MVKEIGETGILIFLPLRNLNIIFHQPNLLFILDQVIYNHVLVQIWLSHLLNG